MSRLSLSCQIYKRVSQIDGIMKLGAYVYTPENVFLQLDKLLISSSLDDFSVLH